MAEPLRRIAVLAHFVTGTTLNALAELAALRGEFQLELLLPVDEAAKHPQAEKLGYRVVTESELLGADACLVFGGDGTILRALGRLLGSGVPTLGVNFGNVGFLASLPHEAWRDGLAEMVEGRYSVAELLTVEARLGTRHYTAVNDIVLSRTESRGVLHLQYTISGTPLGTMRCDGMIIATPTGSTAYNLSCGGPLAVWDANVLLLNFVAPHSLGFRPIVLRPDHEIAVGSVSDCGEVEVVVDGHVVGLLGCDDVLRVSASPLLARLLVGEGVSFYRNVEQKLFGFGVDAHGAGAHGPDAG
jgi:NAD+ kinase